MILRKYFYYKFTSSLIICFFSILIIFYIFSLIGNLGESFKFSTILYLSFINTLQILNYVPSIILLISLILLMIFLRSKNELMIIREYVAQLDLIVLFLPIAISFTFIEINKDTLSNILNDTKSNLINTNNFSDTKLIVENFGNITYYTVLNNLDIKEKKINEFNRYGVSEKSIISGEYSNKLEIKDNRLITKDFTRFQKDQISQIYEKNIILENLDFYMTDEMIIKENKKNINFQIGIKEINLIIYFILFYCCIFTILFHKKLINTKENYFYSTIICVFLFFYSTFITTIKSNSYETELQILGSLIIFLTLFKFYKNG